MEYFNIGFGAFLVGLGFLVKKFPILIAGYNTLSEDRKKKVDIKGLSSLVRNYLVIVGILISGGPHLFNYLGLEAISENIVMISVLGGLPFLMINAQKYDKNTYGKFKRPLIVALNLLFVGGIIGGILTYGSYPPTIELDQRILSISGMYGLTTEIASAELTSELPKIVMRSNGFYFNGVSKGNFKIENGGTIKLFLQSKTGPYILTKSTEDDLIYINGKTKKETEQLFDKLKSKMD